IAPTVAFISVDIYPEKGKAAQEIEGIQKVAGGKPVVIEETFPLPCGVADLRTFLKGSRPFASGWLGHYGNQSLADLESLHAAKKITIPEAMMLDWLNLFREIGPELKGK